MEIATRLTAILPSTNLDASEAFYAKLGFKRDSNYPSYRILSDNNGAHLHLNKVAEDWLVSGGNPFGVYLYTQKRAGCLTWRSFASKAGTQAVEHV